MVCTRRQPFLASLQNHTEIQPSVLQKCTSMRIGATLHLIEYELVLLRMFVDQMLVDELRGLEELRI